MPVGTQDNAVYLIFCSQGLNLPSLKVVCLFYICITFLYHPFHLSDSGLLAIKTCHKIEAHKYEKKQRLKTKLKDRVIVINEKR